MKERALSLYPKKLLNVLPSSSGALPCFQGTAVWWVREGDGSSAGEHSQGVTGNVTAQPWISSFVQLHTHPGRPPGEEHPSDGWSPSALALCWRWCEQQLQKSQGWTVARRNTGVLLLDLLLAQSRHCFPLQLQTWLTQNHHSKCPDT